MSQCLCACSSHVLSSAVLHCAVVFCLYAYLFVSLFVCCGQLAVAWCCFDRKTAPYVWLVAVPTSWSVCRTQTPLRRSERLENTSVAFVQNS